MKSFWIGILSGWVGFSGVGVEASTRPNIVFIVADDLGYADVSIQGCRDFSTPHIDSIAEQGVRFTEGYVSASFCSPSRAGFLTGRYQQRFGHEVLFWNNNDHIGLPVGEVTLADRLREAGYVTGMVGKWHLGKEKQFFPTSRGFMEFFGDPGHGSPYLPNPKTGNVGGVYNKFYRNNDQIQITEYLTDVYARESVEFIERHAAEPFFLYASFTAPHEPLEALPGDLEKVAHIPGMKHRTYAAMILALDRGVGKILEAVQKNGLEENTLVVFLSDNGAKGKQGMPVSRNDKTLPNNAPFRGIKGLVLEGGIRVPFFIKWPGVFPAGGQYEQPVIALDLAPTFFAAAGIDIQSEWQLDGVDLRPYLCGKRDGLPHEQLFWRYWRTGQNKELCAVRAGDWKLITQASLGGEAPGEQRWSLYHLADDPAEQNDLIRAHPEKAEQLEKQWMDWNQSLQRPAWHFDPPGTKPKTKS